MPLYDYKAKTPNGDLIDERVEATSKVEAMVELQNQRLILIDIQEVKQDAFSINLNRVTSKELAAFCKQLGQLIETGVAIHNGIELISEQHKNKYFKSVMEDVVREIKSGGSFSRSIEKFPKVFPDIMIYQMKAAEEGGFLVDTLKNLAINFQREARFKKKIRGAFMYPVFIIFATIGIMWFMMTKIIPQLTKTLSNFDAELPAITQLVMKVSEAFQNYWFAGIGIIIGLFGLMTFILKQPAYRLVFDRFLMKIPLVGNLIAIINIARISRIMSSLMGSAVGIDQTLSNVSKVLNNKAMQEAMDEVKDDVVKRGQTLHKSLEKHSYFPKTFIQIVSIGEEAGNLTDVLEQLADQYEEESEEALKLVTSAINPVLMLGIGGIVGTVVVSMFLPMFSLMNNF